MSAAFDVIVVGAGPGGLAAAATAAESGMRVCLMDDNAAPGGQIWRGGIAQYANNPAAGPWLQRIRTARVEVWTGWRAVAADRVSSRLRVERDGHSEEIAYTSLILATGARELFLPFPGWTLPGVFGVGGLQAFVKSGLDIAGKRVVIAGTGPLLLAVADGLRRSGARIVAVVEQAPVAKLARFSMSLINGHIGKLIEGAGYALRSSGTRFYFGHWVRQVSGDRGKRISITDGSRTRVIDAELLAVGYHLTPNTELAKLFPCELQQGYVRVDARQETSVRGIYCVGEATGIGGVDKAQLEGRIAGLAASGHMTEAGQLTAGMGRQWTFARNLAHAFELRPDLRKLADRETIVCRCEDVTHGSLSGCRSWREAKLHTRCGMGPCQGRICSPAAQFLYGWSLPQPRPPLFPVEMATLGSVVGEQATHLAHK